MNKTVGGFRVNQHRYKVVNGIADMSTACYESERERRKPLSLPCQFSVTLDDHPYPNSLLL